MPTPSDARKLGPFNLGMNNRLPDSHMVVPKVGSYLRSAVNVDISTVGTVKRRQGTSVAMAGADVHSLWAEQGDALFVDGTVMYALNEPANAKTSVRTGMRPGARVSYTRLNGQTIYTDGAVLRRIVANVDTPLGVPKISPEPHVAAGGVGGLTPGLYQVCFTYFDSELRQSGSTTQIQVDVAAGQGIVITNLPAAFPTGTDGVMVYVTACNGDIPFLERALVAPQASLTISAQPQLGGQCPTLGLEPMPAGSIVRQNNGRLLVADGVFLHYSEPFAPALRNPVKGYIVFDDPVTVVESVKTATYVVTEKNAYYFAGDIAAAEMVKVLPYGAAAGSGGTGTDQLSCWWMSTRGLVLGDANGGVKNMQEDKVVVDPAMYAATMYREQDGRKQFIAANFSAGTAGAAAHSFMEAEIVRKGTTL